MPSRQVCGATDNLWICLVCGNVGCGRYTGCGAGVHHNTATDHSFAMELATQRVWDYKGDNYVHRLIQNKVRAKYIWQAAHYVHPVPKGPLTARPPLP